MRLKMIEALIENDQYPEDDVTEAAVELAVELVNDILDGYEASRRTCAKFQFESRTVKGAKNRVKLYRDAMQRDRANDDQVLAGLIERHPNEALAIRCKVAMAQAVKTRVYQDLGWEPKR